MPTTIVHCLIASLLIGAASCLSSSHFCTVCPAQDTSITVCAVQLLSPNVLQTFTQCQLNFHNCHMSLNKYTQIGTGICPAPYTLGTTSYCTNANVCDNSFSPVCGESLITKRKQRFNNECQLHLASCQSPHDPYHNLGNVPCKNWLNI